MIVPSRSEINRQTNEAGRIKSSPFLAANILVSELPISRPIGRERGVLYVLAGTTGLRRKELLNLSWDDVNLSADSAFVRVKASIAKNGKEAKQPIPLIVVNLLGALKAHIRPNDFFYPLAGGLTQQGLLGTI